MMDDMQALEKMALHDRALLDQRKKEYDDLVETIKKNLSIFPLSVSKQAFDSLERITKEEIESFDTGSDDYHAIVRMTCLGLGIKLYYLLLSEHVDNIAGKFHGLDAESVG